MLRADPNFIATQVLSKLAAYYTVTNLEEVVMNRPGWIWVKQRRSQWFEAEAPELTYDYIFKVCKVLANINSAKFSEDDLPVVSCELPGAPYRFQAMIGPNVRYNLDDRKGIALAIRALTADTSIDFSSYGLTQDAKLPGATSGLLAFDLGEDNVKAISEVIKRHESIIISGATSTGKTTFTNKIIEVIDPADRVITVEDARELTVPHANRVHMIVPKSIRELCRLLYGDRRAGSPDARLDYLWRAFDRERAAHLRDNGQRPSRYYNRARRHTG